MIAYTTTLLDQFETLQDAELAFQRKLITKEELKNIRDHFNPKLYNPNIFIRIGLFFATVLVALAFFGLLVLGANSEGDITVLCIMTGGICYGALEIFVHGKHHFSSGVDNALVWLICIFFYSAAVVAYNAEVFYVTPFLILFICGALLAWRFIKISACFISFAGLLGAVFTACFKTGGWMQEMLPFIIIITSALVYVFATRIKTKYHIKPMKALAFFALLMIYAGGNYYVVRETSFEFAMQMRMGWFFWIWTIAIPPVYIYFGIRNKDRILLRTGLLLVAFMVHTIHTYRSLLPTEVILVLGGAIMILVARFVTVYLREPRQGFTAKSDDEQAANVESLVIAESFHETVQPPAAGFDFGGGTGMGGGATGNF